MNEYILEVKNVHRGFSNKSVLRGADLNIKPGQHIGLIGNNGQGKTTLIKVILNLLNTDQGDIFLDGNKVTDTRNERQQALLGYLPETVSFYSNLSGRETIDYFARLKSCSKKDVTRVLDLVGLTHAASDKVQGYSKGMKQRLGLAQALLGRPRLLLLDEPTNGLDPSANHAFYQTLKRLKDEGVAALISSHLLAEIEPHLDCIAILQEGKINKFGEISQLLEDSALHADIVLTLSDTAIAQVLLSKIEAFIIKSKNGSRGHELHIRCPKDHVNQLVKQLLEHESYISNLEIRNPKLEDLFYEINQSKC